MIAYLMCVVAAFPCGAVLGRCAGGFIGTGNTQLARLLWLALPTGFLSAILYYAYADKVSFVLPLATGAAVFVGRLIPHGWCQQDVAWHYPCMSVVGIARTYLIAYVQDMYFPGVFLPLCLVGSLAGVGYLIGYKIVGDRELFIWHPKNPEAAEGFDRFAVKGGEWAEVFAHGLIWSATVAVLLGGLHGFLT